ncbi:hypothetical protein ZIOFF_023770 [Zingiber officinale]|uniref:Protein kinase domain-containing protein n=1 Tax=Zingiber officinale TaxID=94328 RepID=A0A8J5HB28_ZINOF|nr:hypothetical protein ZIOFF_023770 [Zingiber officinale]
MPSAKMKSLFFVCKHNPLFKKLHDGRLMSIKDVGLDGEDTSESISNSSEGSSPSSISSSTTIERDNSNPTNCTHYNSNIKELEVATSGFVDMTLVAKGANEYANGDVLEDRHIVRRELVFEYICNGSLDHHLYGEVQTPLGWLFIEHRIIIDKSDMYAFGVVLLELGRKALGTNLPKGQQFLVKWEGAPRNDMRASLCLNLESQSRPNMPNVLRILKGDNAINQVLDDNTVGNISKVRMPNEVVKEVKH